MVSTKAQLLGGQTELQSLGYELLKSREKKWVWWKRWLQVFFEGHELLWPFQFFTALNKYMKTAFSREQNHYFNCHCSDAYHMKMPLMYIYLFYLDCFLSHLSQWAHWAGFQLCWWAILYGIFDSRAKIWKSLLTHPKAKKKKKRRGVEWLINREILIRTLIWTPK